MGEACTKASFSFVSTPTERVALYMTTSENTNRKVLEIPYYASHCTTTSTTSHFMIEIIEAHVDGPIRRGMKLWTTNDITE